MVTAAPPTGSTRLAPGKAPPWLAPALFGLVALALRASSFGDPNYSYDEGFYALVGQRMHNGVLPYVGIWDRKPFGLFALYYLFAAISPSVWTYQIAGWLASTATAWVIVRMAEPWANRQGAIYAGLAYLVVAPSFDGAGGQAPVFYNLLVAGAAALIIGQRGQLAGGRCGRPIWAAMALLGLAITIKQTSAFEAAFFGLYVVVTLWRAGMPPRQLAARTLGLALTGMTPTLVIALGYALLGHWHAYWQAMVLANLRKQALAPEAIQHNAVSSVVRAAPLLLIVGWSLAWGAISPPIRRFLLGWLVAAFLGYLAVPHFITHHALPLLVPLCAISAAAFARADWGRVGFAAVACYALIWFGPADFVDRQRSITAMNQMAELIHQHDGGGGLLVFDGPPYLYVMAGKAPLSPLVFPQHLNYAGERNVSQLDTVAEVRRIIAGRPGVIAMESTRGSNPLDPATAGPVTDYIRRSCSLSGVVRTYRLEHWSDMAIYGDCGRLPPRPGMAGTTAAQSAGGAP